VVNVHAPSEEKREEVKDSFYEELEEVFDHFPNITLHIIIHIIKIQYFSMFFGN